LPQMVPEVMSCLELSTLHSIRFRAVRDASHVY
jgi:hypothetical protein